MNIWIAVALTFGIALVWLRLMDYIASKGWISSSLSRKIIHIGTGPIFVLCWLFYPDIPISRYLAALVPLGITIQFLLVGLGIIKDQASVDAMSRTGDKREILRGPLFYGIAFVVLTVWFWKDTPIGIIALMILCGGDGLADVIGKSIASRPLPWSSRKTWAGSMAVFAGGFITALAIVSIFIQSADFTGSISSYVYPILIISIASAIVESLPFTDIDNITIPVICIILGYLFF
jgi:phytol kinase